MGDVTRFDSALLSDMYPSPRGRFVEFDDHAHELAALREELAAEKKWYDREIDSADEETSALRDCIRDLKDWREHSQSFSAFESIIQRAEAVISAPGPLRKALTAAEQRNSELSALLSRAQEFVAFVHKCVRKNGEYAPLHWQEMVEIDRDLSAALKPTESGASE